VLEEAIRLLRQTGVADVVDVLGCHSAVSCDIKPYVLSGCMIGPAYTVKLAPGSLSTTILALARAKPGYVMVIDASLCGDVAVFGETFGTEGMIKKLAGFAINGYFRDLEGLHERGVPVYARGIRLCAAANQDIGEMEEPVNLGGVKVMQGDLVMGDKDGVAIIPSARALEIAQKAFEKKQNAEGLAEKIRKGASLADVLGRHQ